MTIPRYGVAGDPVAHSRSPQMHLAAYAALGIDADYQRLPIPAPLFAETVRALPASGFRGINVTIPHKEAALALADSASDAARAIGAANTLTFTGDGKIHADNTDASGLAAALGDSLTEKSALVFGAGGTARATVWALRNKHAEVNVVNRTFSRAEVLAEEFGVSVFRYMPDRPFDFLINTTSVGMDDRDAALNLPEILEYVYERNETVTVVDFVYREGGSQLVNLAREKGLSAIDGHDLLARQGALSFAIWFDVDPPVGIMRAALA